MITSILNLSILAMISTTAAQEDVHLQLQQKLVGSATILVEGEIAQALYDNYLKTAKTESWSPDMGDSATPIEENTRRSTSFDLVCTQSIYFNKGEAAGTHDKYLCSVSAPIIVVEPKAKFFTLKMPFQSIEHAVTLTQKDPTLAMTSKQKENAKRDNFTFTASSPVKITGAGIDGDFAQTIFEQTLSTVTDAPGYENSYNARKTIRARGAMKCEKITVKYPREATRTVYSCYFNNAEEVAVNAMADVLDVSAVKLSMTVSASSKPIANPNQLIQSSDVK